MAAQIRPSPGVFVHQKLRVWQYFLISSLSFYCQGKYRQLRRMCDLVGLNVVKLKRVGIGRLTLGDLGLDHEDEGAKKSEIESDGIRREVPRTGHWRVLDDVHVNRLCEDDENWSGFPPHHQ
jgi:hypothetical protein